MLTSLFSTTKLDHSSPLLSPLSVAPPIVQSLRRLCSAQAGGQVHILKALGEVRQPSYNGRSRCGRSGHRADAMTDEEEQTLRARLAQLRQEHGDLDAAISAMIAASNCDQLQLTRFKKRKLQLKEQIARIEDSLLPDITA